MTRPKRPPAAFAALAALLLAAAAPAPAAPPQNTLSADFSALPLGATPPGWTDFSAPSVNPVWIRDGLGFLRVASKRVTGLLAWPATVRDGSISARFKKTPDDSVWFGLAGRLRDPANFYLVKFSGDSRLSLVKFSEGRETVLRESVTLNRLDDGETWTLSLETRGDLVTGRLLDAAGVLQERVDARDAAFAQGAFALAATNFAAVRSVEIASANPLSATAIPARRGVRVLEPLPLEKVPALNTPFGQAADAYDVVVAGAGTGGWAAAIQAARMGASVLLLEETDWIGGQMAAAAVCSMDEEGCWEKFPVRERGLYREFHESVTNFYWTRDKDPYRAYYAWPDQLEGGYEPKIARATLAAFIADARENGAALDLLTRTKVARVLRDGTAVTGVEIANAPSGATRTVRCKILVEATEYGDILPLSGARYRVAGTTSDKLPSEKANPAVLQARALAKSLIAEKDVFEKLLKHGGSGLAAGTPAAAEVVRKLAAALRKAGKTGAADRLDAATPEVFQALLASILQYHTWCGVIREYPEGVPGHLLLKTPPPGYDPARYANKQLHGAFVWGAAGRDVKGPRDYRVEFAWRGMADSDSPANGALTFHRHTQCGLNGGDQDYPVTVDAIETPAERRLAEREGILRTLSKIYYYQRELGLPWAVAEDEGYDTPANRALMREMNLPPDLYEHAVRLPQHPYARESRRGIGLHTLKASELSRWENARHFQTSVAMGDYYMDLDHGPTGHAAEKDVDGDLSAPGSLPRGGGPFQVPFGVFVPESVDGLVLAEKNISQSRIANGATRLQPVTMLTGQAAGAIAALSVREKKQPRRLNPIAVQSALLDAGSNLIQRWFGDVPWGSPLWRATQILALHKVMDPPGPFNKKRGEPVGGGNLWRPDEPLARDDADAAVRRLAKLSGKKTAAVAAELPAGASRGAFAIAAAGWLVKNCEPEGAP